MRPLTLMPSVELAFGVSSFQAPPIDSQRIASLSIDQ